jgi:four helix bundle protein
MADGGCLISGTRRMNSEELKAGTKQFALRLMKLVGALPKTTVGRAIGGQLVRGATSVVANYRAACRARSKAEFAAKLGTVAEEADETCFWLEMIIEGELVPAKRAAALLEESNALTAIFTPGVRTSQRRRDR